MSHTPGPWQACGNDARGICKCGTIWGDDHPVATVQGSLWGDRFPAIRISPDSGDTKAEAYMATIEYGAFPEDQVEANARLIAAAPDLLLALKYAAATLKSFDAEGLTDLSDLNHEDAITYNIVCAAIELAEGAS